MSSRILAALVDGAIFLPLIGLSLFLSRVLEEDDPLLAGWGLASAILGLTYSLFFTTRGGTPGYRALHIRVQTPDGENPTLKQAVIRDWAGIVTIPLIWGSHLLVIAGLAGPRILDPQLISGTSIRLTSIPSLIMLLGCLTILDDPRKRALHDKWADTEVVFINR